MIELTLVHDQFEFEPSVASTSTEQAIEVASPKTPFQSQENNKKCSLYEDLKKYRLLIGSKHFYKKSRAKN